MVPKPRLFNLSTKPLYNTNSTYFTLKNFFSSSRIESPYQMQLPVILRINYILFQIYSLSPEYPDSYLWHHCPHFHSIRMLSALQDFYLPHPHLPLTQLMQISAPASLLRGNRLYLKTLHRPSLNYIMSHCIFLIA